MGVEIRSDAVIGNRANFGFVSNNNVVFLYGHWAGANMLGKLANALQAVIDAERVNDREYGTRIAMSQLVGKSWDNDAGWGISVNYLADNEHSVPVVDFDNNNVALYPAPDWFAYIDFDNPKFVMPIDVFVKKFQKVLENA